MRHTHHKTTIELVLGDITTQAVDAIVNAANAQLAGGAGVDGAIHRKGGPTIMAECRKIIEARGDLKPGQCAITTGGDLPARHVIHAVGPIWRDGQYGENVALERAFESSLELARSLGLKTIAFPAISCGAYGFPPENAALIALSTLFRHAAEHPGALDQINLVLFDTTMLQTFERALDKVIRTQLGTGHTPHHEPG